MRFVLIISLLILAFLVSCEEKEPARVQLLLHPLEQLATRNGPKIVVSVDGKVAGELSAKLPKLFMSRTQEAQLVFAYVGPNGEPTDVTWSQSVSPNDNKLVVVQPWRRPDRSNDWHVLAWARPADRTKALERLPKEVTVVSPIWWTIEDDGVVEKNSDAEFATLLRRKGVAIWLAIQGLDANGLHAFLSNDARRSQVATEISAQAKVLAASGINVDIEGFHSEDSDAVGAFVEELADLVHAWGGTISYDIVPRSDSWESLPAELSHWSNAPQRRRIAAAVDYTVLMAYDQFNEHRPGGPVASPNWVEEVLVYLLRYADPQSIILGVPAYGRIWNPDAPDSPHAVSLSRLSGRDGTRTFDDKHCVDRVTRPDGSYYWAEREIAAARIKLAFDYGLAGVAVWRMGLDYRNLWDVIRILEQRHRSVLSEIRENLYSRSSRLRPEPKRWGSCLNEAH